MHADHDDTSIVVRVAGEVDLATAPALRARLFDAIDGNGHDVVLDLADVTFMDSTALAVLVDANNCLRSTRRTLHITTPAASVRRLIEISGLNAYFDLPQLDGDEQA